MIVTVRRRPVALAAGTSASDGTGLRIGVVILLFEPGTYTIHVNPKLFYSSRLVNGKKKANHDKIEPRT